MRKIIEYAGYILPAIGGVSLLLQMKENLMKLPYIWIDVVLSFLFITTVASIHWFKMADREWFTKVFTMITVSLLFVFISREKSLKWILVSIAAGIIAGISAQYIKYEFSFIDKENEKSKYYPENYNFSYYGWMVLPVKKDVKDAILSFKNKDVDIHSIALYLDKPLKTVLKNIAELEKEGKIKIIFRNGKTFLGDDEDEER